jgi:CheY-like chemotaxis protein
VSSQLRILYLEDDPKDAELAQTMLETEDFACHVTRVDTQVGFCASLEQDGFNLILADYTPPSFDGISALKIAAEKRPEVPFIFVSGTLGEEVAIEALNEDAAIEACTLGGPCAAGSCGKSRAYARRGVSAPQRGLPG